MNKKAQKELPEFVGEMIGVVIVLGLIMIMFAGFASPILEYLSTYESVKNYNRYMISMSTACELNADTITYLSFPASGKNAFAIGLVHDEFARNITELDICDGSNELCTTKNSKSKIDVCSRTFSYCFCLFRVTLKEGCVLNDKYDVVITDRTELGDLNEFHGNIKTSIDEIIEQLTIEKNNPSISKIEVIQCKELGDTNCMYTEPETENVYPVLFSAYGEGNVIWMHTRGDRDKNIHKSLFLYSLSFQREIFRGEYYYYSNMYSHPELKVLHIDDFEGDNNQLIRCD